MSVGNWGDPVPLSHSESSVPPFCGLAVLWVCRVDHIKAAHGETENCTREIMGRALRGSHPFCSSLSVYSEKTKGHRYL